MKQSKFKALSLMGGVQRKLVILALTLIMTLAMTVSSFADIEITKTWDDDLAGSSAKNRSTPTVTLTGETSYEKLLNMFYPVGCYFETEDDSFDPNTAWGGTWTKQTKKNDYVVDEGSSGSWTYRKWNSGIAELWLYDNRSYSAGETIITLTFPITFSDTNYSIHNGVSDPAVGGNFPSYGTNVGAHVKNTTSLQYRMKTTIGSTIGSSWYIRGNWKSLTTPEAINRWKRTA